MARKEGTSTGTDVLNTPANSSTLPLAEAPLTGSEPIAICEAVQSVRTKTVDANADLDMHLSQLAVTAKGAPFTTWLENSLVVGFSKKSRDLGGRSGPLPDPNTGTTVSHVWG